MHEFFLLSTAGKKRHRPVRCRSRRQKTERRWEWKFDGLLHRFMEAYGIEPGEGRVLYGEAGAKAILEAAENLRLQRIESN